MNLPRLLQNDHHFKFIGSKIKQVPIINRKIALPILDVEYNESKDH